MSLIKELFGKSQAERRKQAVRTHTPASLPPIRTPAAPAASVSPAPAKDSDTVKIFDAQGREIHIKQAAWRATVLPAAIKTNWNHPDRLHGIIQGALADGFRADVRLAAEQLYKIDPQLERGAGVWSTVLTEEGRLEEAEKVLRGFLAKQGETGLILTNLARVYSHRRNGSQAEEILWHALEVDPNQESGLAWYGTIHHGRGGEGGEMARMEAWLRVAALPGSWRAQCWLARDAIQAKDLEQALVYYQQGLSQCSPPVPADLLAQISSDLGHAGHLTELLSLTEPHFVVEVHGLPVGNNIIKAHLGLGQFEAARRVMNQLYALKLTALAKDLEFTEPGKEPSPLNARRLGVAEGDTTGMFRR